MTVLMATKGIAGVRLGLVYGSLTRFQFGSLQFVDGDVIYTLSILDSQTSRPVSRPLPE
jgi:hypothetical protein